ncbi:MAG TPA: metallopeptidase family protein [Gaiellaceae bacterium]|jgi:predicted Zn-dependent protease with MMP-like domain|nr:metallopeptidase family protein [Gaiellaceae bacterium]
MQFEEQVEAALADLPPEFARALENVAVVIEEQNPDEPDLFGWYDGLGPGRDHAGALPDRIVIYRRPLERAFSDPEELRREIRVTVLHEVGHFFGLDEQRIDELGYG